MPLPETTRMYLEDANFGALEDEWLERVDEHAGDIDYFAAASRALAEAEQSDQARALLRLLDEELEAAGLSRERLDLVLAVGDLYVKPAGLHAHVVDAVRTLHDDSESLPDMLRVSGLSRSTTDLRSLRLMVERLDSLLELDVGSVVSMEGKGVGRIAAINFDLGSYKVDFEKHAGLTVGFKAGAKLLRPLPSGHVLRTKLESPETLERLRDEEPSELLRLTLQSDGEALTASEIRAVLDGVVTKAQWASWWAAARTHPQVLVTTDARQKYHWAESGEHAEDALLDAFDAGDLTTRLDLFAKNARQNPELAQRMAGALAETAAERFAAEPARAIEIWIALDRFGLTADDADFAPAAVVARHGAANLLRQATGRGVRQVVLDAAQATDPAWPEVFADWLTAEPDVGLVGRIAGALGSAAAEILDGSIDGILSQPNRAPAAFLWLAQAAGDDETLRRTHARRLFQRLLAAVGRPEFAPYRSTLEPLLESGGTLPKLIADLDPADAEAAEAAVERSALKEFVKEPLVNALHLRFPDRRAEQQNTLYALPESIDKRREEAQHLLTTEIPANRKAIQEAAALGDLRENFEYKSARERHEYLSARLGKLQTDLARAQPIDFSLLDGKEIRVGTTAELRDAAGDLRKITVLGPWESDPENHLVSYLSDLGEELIESRIGDTVRVADADYEVIGIRPYRSA